MDNGQHPGKFFHITLFDRAAHHGSLFRCAVLHGVNQRQRGFAFSEIVTKMFAGLLFVRRVIQHIVDQLECGAEVHAVSGGGFFIRAGCSAENRAQAHRRLEQLGGLAMNHMHVAGGIHTGVMAVEQLQYLALGDCIGGICQRLHHAHFARLDHHLEGA